MYQILYYNVLFTYNGTLFIELSKNLILLRILETEKIKSIEYEIDLPEKNLLFILIGLGLILFEFLVKSTILKGIS